MNYCLEIYYRKAVMVLEFGDNQASRGAVMAGLNQARGVTVKAYDIDEKGKRWEK